MKYEKTPEDKKRRKYIKNSERGAFLKVGANTRCNTAVLASKLRQGYSVYKLGSRKVKEHKMLIGVVLFLTSVWLSGFFAHAGLRFESLLSVVVGVLILGIVAYRENK